MRLVFVAGWMRSGTTVLTEILGSSPGALAVGELATMWTALENDDPCSCGEPVRRCPVWSVVARRIEDEFGIGPNGATGYLDFDAVVREALRIKRLPVLLRLRRHSPHQFPPDIRRVVDVLHRVLTVVAEQSGCEVIVDSSKRPAAMVAFGLLPDTVVSPVHLVRDPRAVAYSESRQGRWSGVRPQLAPPGRGVLLSAVHWNVTSILCHLVGLRYRDYRLLRYEELTRDPRRTTSELTAGLGLAGPAFLEADTLQLAGSHVVSGNPSRFGGRRRTITADERWRTGMPASERVAVGLLTAPVRLLLRWISR